MALPTERRCGVPAGRIKNSGFCRFPIPCFVPGCHTFGLKIAASGAKNCALLAMTQKWWVFCENLPFLLLKCLKFVAERRGRMIQRIPKSCGRGSAFPVRSLSLARRANFRANFTVKLRADHKIRFILRRRASQRLRRRPPAPPSGLPRSSRPPPAPFPARRPAGSRRRAKAPRPPYRRDRRPSRRKAPP